MSQADSTGIYNGPCMYLNTPNDKEVVFQIGEVIGQGNFDFLDQLDLQEMYCDFNV